VTPWEAISESALQSTVVEMAEVLGWTAYHTYDSRRSQRGFPDLVMVRQGRVIFAELKSAKGRVPPEQQHWLDQLRQCPGVETYLWRPSDLDQITEALR
jgi:hypothetical protein